MLEHLTDLRAERTALIDRVNVVLAALKLKGGDPAEYEQYVKAVSGIEVDVSDASATGATITGWPTSAEGGLRWVVNLAQFVIILIAFYFLSVVAAKAAQKGLAAQLALLAGVGHGHVASSCWSVGWESSGFAGAVRMDMPRRTKK